MGITNQSKLGLGISLQVDRHPRRRRPCPFLVCGRRAAEMGKRWLLEFGFGLGLGVFLRGYRGIAGRRTGQGIRKGARMAWNGMVWHGLDWIRLRLATRESSFTSCKPNTRTSMSSPISQPRTKEKHDG